MLFGFQMFGTGRIYDFIDSLTRGIQAGAQERDCDLLLACGVSMLNPETLRPAWPQPADDTDFVPVGPWNTDGLIVVHPLCSPARSRYIRELKASGFPVVYVGAAEGAPAIDLDNNGGVRQALAHLVQHGHRKLAFIGGVPDDQSGDSGVRQRSFEMTMREYGLDLDPDLADVGHHHVVGGREAMQRIIARNKPFTAVLASNDESALGAMQALAETGRRVPEDVAVIGFDNRPDVAHGLPSLTTVHHPVFERGYRALHLLADLLQGGGDATSVVSLPTRLVLRRSCGCTLDDILAIGSAPPLAPKSPTVLQTRIARAMAEAILTQTLRTEPAEVHEATMQLLDALVGSLETRHALGFLGTLRSLLARAEQTERDAGVWLYALEALSESADLPILCGYFSASKSESNVQAFVELLLESGRAAVAAHRERQNWVKRHFSSEVSGYLTARLLAARDEEEILDILAEQAPKVGIPRAAIALFVPEGDDPVALCSFRHTGAPDAVPSSIRSREFPPPLFAPGATSTRFVLVPIVRERDLSGFLALESDNLGLCASVAHAVNTALRTSRMYRAVVETSQMYHDALEHRRAAEEASSLKSRFLSAVSHELRTPLSFILAASEFLEKEKLNPGADYTQNLAHIRTSAQQLDGLVRDVLDLSRDEIGQLRLTCAPVDLSATLRPVAAVGEQLARAKGLAWRAEFPSDIPRAYVDAARVRQVALNLVTNAVKFTTRGEVALSVELDRGRLRVSVRDTGVGVPPQERETIFDEFNQSTRTAGRHDGVGLGLAICRRLVEMHGGEIGVHSSGTEGEGATFSFTLPALHTDLAAIAGLLVRDAPVFVLDSHSDDAEVLYRYLEQQGLHPRRLPPDDPTEWLAAMLGDPPGTLLVDTAAVAHPQADVLKRIQERSGAERAAVMFYALAPAARTTPEKLDYLTQPIGSMDLARALQRQGMLGEQGVKTILVVEDDPRLLDMHVKIVQTLSATHRVLKAGNGRDAIRLVREERPDLVLLDLIMPHLDGFAVLDAMKEYESTRNIPVIVLSGQALTDEEMARFSRSVAAVLTKGVFSVEETQTQIRHTLEHTGAIGEARQVVRRAMAHVHEHYREPLSRPQIAQHLGISENHLTRCFRQVLHVPPMSYLTRYRISRAKMLLAGGDTPVMQIAGAVGFPNEFYFSYVFRRETGMTPSAYRRSQRPAAGVPAA